MITGSIYMAPSSVRGLDGMGLFTTEDMNQGEDFLSSYDGPSIPVIDHRQNWLEFDEFADFRSRWSRLFNDYWWGRGVPDHTRYEADKVMDFQITFGALPNHHCALTSIGFKYLPPAYDDTLVDPRSSPGIGAISYHNGRNFFAKVRTVQSNRQTASRETWQNCTRSHMQLSKPISSSAI